MSEDAMGALPGLEPGWLKRELDDASQQHRVMQWASRNAATVDALMAGTMVAVPSDVLRQYCNSYPTVEGTNYAKLFAIAHPATLPNPGAAEVE